MDEEIWNEFNDRWDELAYERERLIKKYSNVSKLEEWLFLGDMPKGAEKTALIKQRINQSFFREAVLASYNGCCCITGFSNPELLIASHIKPWKDSSNSEKNESNKRIMFKSFT